MVRTWCLHTEDSLIWSARVSVLYKPGYPVPLWVPHLPISALPSHCGKGPIYHFIKALVEKIIFLNLVSFFFLMGWGFLMCFKFYLSVRDCAGVPLLSADPLQLSARAFPLGGSLWSRRGSGFQKLLRKGSRAPAQEWPRVSLAIPQWVGSSQGRD